MDRVLETLFSRLSRLFSACLAMQYLLLAVALPKVRESVAAPAPAYYWIAELSVFLFGTTALYLFVIKKAIRSFRADGWRRAHPELDLSGVWKTCYKTNKSEHVGDLGHAWITQDWLGNVAVQGAYVSEDAQGITDARWESTSYRLIEDRTGRLQAIMTYHSRRSPRTGTNVLAKDGLTARGVEELNVYCDRGKRPARIEGAFYVYAQSAKRMTNGLAWWDRLAEEGAPDRPPDAWLNSSASFAQPQDPSEEPDAGPEPEPL